MVVLRGTVDNIFSSRLVRSGRRGPNWANDHTDIILEHSPEQWHLKIGVLSFILDERPEFERGDQITITIAKEGQ